MADEEKLAAELRMVKAAWDAPAMEAWDALCCLEIGHPGETELAGEMAAAADASAEDLKEIAVHLQKRFEGAAIMQRMEQKPTTAELLADWPPFRAFCNAGGGRSPGEAYRDSSQEKYGLCKRIHDWKLLSKEGRDIVRKTLRQERRRARRGGSNRAGSERE